MKNKNINYSKLFNLNNKKAIVLGGLGLIGYETTKAFLDLGAEVLIVDIKLEKSKINKLVKKYGPKLKFLNHSKFTDKNIISISKKYSILVNCIYDKGKDWDRLNFDQISIKNFKSYINKITLSSMWYPIIFAKSLKKNSKSGSIINLGSIYGLVAQDEKIYKDTKITENIVYNYNKSGLINFTKAIAAKYAKYGIRSNIVCPGGIRDKKNSHQNNSFLKNYSRRVPIGRLAEPFEIAAVISFLASDGSSYVNGSSIIVDGGWLSI